MARTPQYAEIANDIRAEITEGRLPPGAKLLTERELMDRYDVSVTVARNAIAQLRGEGLVESRQGKGSFVRERRELVRYASRRYRRTGLAPNRAEAARGGWNDTVSDERRVVSATPDVAERLAIEPGDMVSEAVYRWRADNELIQISRQWEPLKLTAGTPIEKPSSGERGQPDVITRFDSIGMKVTHVQEYIRARMPRPDESRELSLSSGVPVLHIIRTHFAGDLPLETADIVIRADRMVIENINDVAPEDADA
ncbi:GntR family transcriptional regulator [Pilimelia terevasa]|uniref:GntR family transcriptional regulator n=1 Tax=Pilimelia terevasa TaxID=53372 RepID=A0A8J3FLT8_9ACTN|nr:GntR family transcriptional regulator [Pilimelia terevasa]GGK38195.1 GntR family transcriptional regulator [Pilimelia terevasa]